MRIIKAHEEPKEGEAKVSFKNTVTGETVWACVSTIKKPTIVKNTTYAYGMHTLIQPYDKAISEKEIFDKSNHFGDDDLSWFIMMPTKEGDMRVGFGKGCLFGGLEKELEFRQDDEILFEHVESIQRDMQEVEKIRNKHNFLFGDGNTEKMDEARKKQHELERELEDLTDWVI